MTDVEVILTVKVPGRTGDHQTSFGFDHLLLENLLPIQQLFYPGVTRHVLRQLHKNTVTDVDITGSLLYAKHMCVI